MSQRAYSIDILRGLAIIGMVLSGQIAHFAQMPAWLFHAQTPPPDFAFNPTIPGITWVDLVFPFFLFAMGAALPLSLGRKIDTQPALKTFWSIIQRGFLLVLFAKALGNTSFWLLYETVDNLGICIALTLMVWGAFCALFLRFQKLSEHSNNYLNLGGGAVLVAMLIIYHLIGVPISIQQSDIIILILANVVVTGSLIWWLTRKNHLARLAIIAAIVALKLTSTISGSWNEIIWNWSCIEWLFKTEYLQYLCIILPGSFAGDMILKWLNTPHDVEKKTILQGNMLIAISLMCLLFISNMWGLYTRELTINLALTIALGSGAWWLLRRINTKDGRLLYNLFAAGFVWLLLGLIFEAAENGIKKDIATISYFFVTSGLASFVVVAGLALYDIPKRKGNSLILCGQNPMVAYTAAGYIVVPVLYLLSFVIPIPWLTGYTGLFMGIGRGVIITLIVAVITVIFTRRKLFWRT